MRFHAETAELQAQRYGMKPKIDWQALESCIFPF